MSNILNHVFSNFYSLNNLSSLNNLTKPNSSKNNLQQYKANHMYKNNFTPALTQGEKFTKYQNKIIKNLEKKINYVNSKEGFQTQNGNSLTSQTISVINNNDFSSQEQTIKNLKQEYKSTLHEYEKLIDKIKGSTKNYLDRVNTKNPYLGKNVCLSSGSCGYVTQKGVFKLYPTTDIFNSTAGQNGCPNTAYININGDGDVNTIGSSISSNPPLVVGTPMTAGQSCGNEGSSVFVDKLIGDTTVSYVGCYADNATTPLMTFIGDSPSETSSPSYTYDQCKEAAINNAYRYFALQGVDNSTSKGYCTATNDKNTATSLGNSYIISGQTALWASGTVGDNQGSVAMLNGDGTLVVNNTSGATIFTTPVPESVKSQPNPYIGCYKLDNSSKDNEIATRYSLTFDQCQDLATDKGYQYFGVGGNNRGSIVKKCFGYNDLDSAQSNGLSKKCKNETSGGSSAASIYATDNVDTLGNSFLILQDDGNMCIYNGTGPSDNQGLIWASGTNGKQQDPNPIYAAANGKYGKNWILNDSTLAVGDFVGSNNGNLALIMQADGNLVLYTFTQATNCQKMADGNMGAGVAGNALYDIGKVGDLASLSKTAYIDQDSNLHVDSSQTKSKTLVYENFESGSGSNTANIDSNMYDNYKAAGKNTMADGLKNATATQRQMLSQLQTKLNLLGSQISGYTGNFNQGLQESQTQSSANIQGIKDYIQEIDVVNNKINSFDSNVENILNDTDIVVLQKNYEYLFWTILAAGTVLVAMNIVKKTNT